MGSAALHAEPDHSGRRAFPLRLLVPRERHRSAPSADAGDQHAVDLSHSDRHGRYRAVGFPPPRGKVRAGPMTDRIAVPLPSVIVQDVRKTFTLNHAFSL